MNSMRSAELGMRNEEGKLDMGAKGFWEWMERAPQSAARISWDRRLGTNFERVAAVVLRPTERDAQWVPCPDQCCGGHRLVPGHDGGGGFLGVCDDDDPPCEDLILTSGEARVWEMDYARLGRNVARALGCEPRDVELGSARCRQIGTFSGAGVPVVMVLPTGAAEFRDCVNRVFSQLREHFILLAPTGRFMEACCHGLLKTAKAGFFDLDSVLALDPDGRWRSLRDTARLFSVHLPQRGEPASDDEARRLFALLKELDAANTVRKAPVSQVFRLYCLEGLSRAEVAKRCGCVESLVTLRLHEIERKLGRKPAELRELSPEFECIEESLSDPRARHIHRRSAMEERDEE